MASSRYPGGERTLREAIDRRIESWLDEAPTRLATDAARPFDGGTDRLPGRFLVRGLAASGGRQGSDRSVAAAACVELLQGQALLNARAAGLADTGFTGVDRTRALLASDYLHSLAYLGPDEFETDPSIRQACYASLSAASRRLAACWTRAEAEGLTSVGEVPIEPIVTATAGDLAGVLGRADADCRRALRTTGATLGVARWSGADGGPPEDWPAPIDALVPDGWRGMARSSDDVEELLAPLPDSPALGRLRDLAASVLTARDRPTHE